MLRLNTSAMKTNAQTRAVVPLGLAQTLAWASSYYLPAMLAAPMARDLGIATPTVFAAFSVALVVSAFVGPWSGRLIDRHGGRPVLIGTSLLFAAGLAALGMADSTTTLFAAWALMGIAMGSGLYEAAFSGERLMAASFSSTIMSAMRYVGVRVFFERSAIS